MIVTHEVKMDLARVGAAPRISVVQDDRYSRNLRFTLYSQDRKWEPGEGTEAVIRYAKSDGRGGSYNMLPDGTQAYEIEENVLTVALAPQVCTAVGPVELAVRLIRDSAELSTFSVKLDVQPVTGLSVNSEDYYRLSGTVPNSGWEPELYLGTDSQGNVVTRDNRECVKRVNGLTPDDTGNVEIKQTGVQTINGVPPDDDGNIIVSTNALPPPATARAGDYLRVKAVSEAGRVMAVEAVSGELMPKVTRMYLYGSAALPALPEHDASAFPHELIDFDVTAAVYTLHFLSGKAAVQERDGGIFFGGTVDTGNIAARCTYDRDSEAWTDMEYVDTDSVFLSGGGEAGLQLVWSSSTIIGADGTVYCTGTEPVAVTEEDGQTVALETATGLDMDAPRGTYALTQADTARLAIAAEKKMPFPVIIQAAGADGGVSLVCRVDVVWHADGGDQWQLWGQLLGHSLLITAEGMTVGPFPGAA